MLTVETPANDFSILTVAERREAAGVTDGTQDDSLALAEARIADAISTHCNIAVAGEARPTLRRETLQEVFRQVRRPTLILARRHGVNITNVVVDGLTLDPDEYEARPESGILYRLDNDTPIPWQANKVTVTYAAGFTSVPADLKMAAMDFFRLAWLEKSRDPALKAQEIDIPGVERIKSDFWIGTLPGVAEGVVPEVVAGQLQRFRNLAI